MRELLEYLARALVDEPDAVAVEQFEEDDGTVVLELVGRRGRLRQGHRPGRAAPPTRCAPSSRPPRCARTAACSSTSSTERSPLTLARAGSPAGRVGRPHGLDGCFHVTRPRPALLPLGATVARRRARRARSSRRAGHRRAPDPAPGGLRRPRGGRGAARRGPARRARRGARRWARTSGGPRTSRAARSSTARAASGTVRRLLALPSCEVLEVERAGAGDLLVPLVRDAVRAGRRRRRGDRRRPRASWATPETDAVMQLDVVTLFPEWFEWFRDQRHVANALAHGHELRTLEPARRTRRSAAARSTTRRSAAAPGWCCASTSWTRRCAASTASTRSSCAASAASSR